MQIHKADIHVDKDLLRAQKMAKDLLDELEVVNAESEQMQGLEGDLKVQLKTLTVSRVFRTILNATMYIFFSHRGMYNGFACIYSMYTESPY